VRLCVCVYVVFGSLTGCCDYQVRHIAVVATNTVVAGQDSDLLLPLDTFVPSMLEVRAFPARLRNQDYLFAYACVSCVVVCVCVWCVV
jgi:hypothetical protein